VRGVVLHPLLLNPEPHFDHAPGAGIEAGIVLLEVAVSGFEALPEAEVGKRMQGAQNILLLLLPLIKIHQELLSVLNYKLQEDTKNKPAINVDFFDALDRVINAILISIDF
jgi:hypothetical protein